MLFVWPSNPQNQTWNRSWETLKLLIIDPDSTWWWLLCQAQGFHPPPSFSGSLSSTAFWADVLSMLFILNKIEILELVASLLVMFSSCAMMQQNRTCTIDQATPTKCLIFTLLATVSKCHNSHSWSKHNCGINATPLPTPLLPFHYNLPESAAETISVFGRDVFWS